MKYPDRDGRTQATHIWVRQATSPVTKAIAWFFGLIGIGILLFMFQIASGR
jgi:hypothetical protein